MHAGRWRDDQPDDDADDPEEHGREGGQGRAGELRGRGGRGRHRQVLLHHLLPGRCHIDKESVVAHPLQEARALWTQRRKCGKLDTLHGVLK